MSSGATKEISCCNCGSDRTEHEVLVRASVNLGPARGIWLAIVGCRRCGLVFQNPQMTPGALSAFYEEHDAYRTDLPRDEQIRYLRGFAHKKKLISYPWLVAQIGEPQHQRILDLGSCNGVWLDVFHPSNVRVGIELSKAAAQQARTLFGIETHEVDCLDNGLPSASFDLVTGLHVIEHFLDPLAALVEINRLLRVGGHLYMEAPSVKGVVLRQGRAACFKAVHTFYFSAETIGSLLEKAGFDVVAMREVPAYTPPTTLFSPQNYASGCVEVVARKRADVDLPSARSAEARSRDFNAARAAIAAAETRDRFFLAVDAAKRAPIVGIAVKAALRVGRQLFGRPIQSEALIRSLKAAYRL